MFSVGQTGEARPRPGCGTWTSVRGSGRFDPSIGQSENPQLVSDRTLKKIDYPAPWKGNTVKHNF